MSNVILGANGIAIRQGIYAESSVQMTDLGRFIDFEDGRRFRYCKASGAVTKGHMAQSPAVIANHAEVVQTGYTNAIGAKKLNVLLTTTVPTKDQYADGYLLVNKVTGLGQMHRIKHNSAAIAPCVIELYDKLVVAIAADSEITLIANKYLSVIVIPTTATGVPIGVPLITITTGGYYFWAQTRGYCPLMVDTGDTLVKGEPAGYPTTPAVAGAAGVPTVTDAIWGITMTPGAADEYAIVDLKLE